MHPVTDLHGRVIDYMRISVTDRCNLRCVYCMPPGGVTPIPCSGILRYEEIIRVARITAALGISKIRITGGEPLVRKDLVRLVDALSRIKGIADISLTTNGLLLNKYAHELAAAGLRRVNVSLDSMKPDRYREITRGGDIERVFEGIQAAEEAGLLPLKLNMIPIRGLNDDELEEFALLTLHTPYHVRFIELMPSARADLWSRERCLTTDEMKSRTSAIAPLIAVRTRSDGPARHFRFVNGRGVIGFISPITHHFCDSCNRLRLTADGSIRPCLFSEATVDLKDALRGGAADAEIDRLIRFAAGIKPPGHSIRLELSRNEPAPMSRNGG